MHSPETSVAHMYTYILRKEDQYIAMQTFSARFLRARVDLGVFLHNIDVTSVDVINVLETAVVARVTGLAALVLFAHGRNIEADVLLLADVRSKLVRRVLPQLRNGI